MYLTKSGEAQKHGEPWTVKSGGGGSGLGALYKFTPMITRFVVASSLFFEAGTVKINSKPERRMQFGRRLSSEKNIYNIGGKWWSLKPLAPLQPLKFRNFCSNVRLGAISQTFPCIFTYRSRHFSFIVFSGNT